MANQLVAKTKGTNLTGTADVVDPLFLGRQSTHGFDLGIRSGQFPAFLIGVYRSARDDGRAAKMRF
jgi:hypothetical protein